MLDLNKVKAITTARRILAESLDPSYSDKLLETLGVDPAVI